jgi:hypothetical protein
MKRLNAIPQLLTCAWVKDEAAFIFSFHPPFIKFFSDQFSNPGRLLEDFLERNPGFRFDLGKTEDGIGLNGCLRHQTIKDGIFSFKYKVPSFYGFSPNVCPKCAGTKINPDNNRKCYHCRETGKEVIENSNGVQEFSSFCLSLYIFFKLADYCALDYSPHASAEYFKEHTPQNASDQQTMLFQFSEETGMTKAWAWSWLHNDSVRKVLDFEHEEELAVCEAMRDVQAALLLTKEPTHYFQLGANDDSKFWLMVPGSACTLGIESQSINNWDWGSILSPHNIDHRTAQISFLAGMTVIDEITRKK